MVDLSDPMSVDFVWKAGEIMSKAKALLYLAAFGLVASAVMHVATLLGVNPLRGVPGAIVLHALLFVVWIPTVVMVVRKMCARDDRWNFWGVVTHHAPLWMKSLSVVLVLRYF